jgi:hypothetical protein
VPRRSFRANRLGKARPHPQKQLIILSFILSPLSGWPGLLVARIAAGDRKRIPNPINLINPIQKFSLPFPSCFHVLHVFLLKLPLIPSKFPQIETSHFFD